MDSGSPPPVPDPIATANAQGAANLAGAQQTAELNRYNQYTPYGSLTWNRPEDTFDQAGYDAAMTAWQNNQGAGRTVTGYDGEGNPIYGGSSSGTQPNRADFTTSNNQWSSTVNLDPRVKALLDSQLSTSQGLNTSINSALSRVQQMMGQGINYGGLPAAGSASGALADAEGRFTDNDAAIQGQQGLVAGGQAMMGQQGQRLNDLLGTPMPEASEATRQQVIEAMFEQAMSRIDPRLSEGDDRLRTDLMNRGIVEGSDAWDNSMDQFGRTANDAVSGALWEAITRGGQEQERLLNMGLSTRDQGLQESTTLASIVQGLTGQLQGLLGQQANTEATKQQVASSQFGMQNTERQTALTEEERKRALVMNELASLRSGANVQMPEFAQQNTAVNVNPAPHAQSVWNAYQGELGQYQTDVASDNSTMAGIMKTIATIAPFLMAASDRRLKRNIKRIGAHPLGIGWYSFTYTDTGMSAEGVMADEVLTVRPDAVFQGPNGYLMVDYGGLA